LIERFSAKVLGHFETGELKVYVDKVFKINWSDVTPVIYSLKTSFKSFLVPRST